MKNKSGRPPRLPKKVMGVAVPFTGTTYAYDSSSGEILEKRAGGTRVVYKVKEGTLERMEKAGAPKGILVWSMPEVTISYNENDENMSDVQDAQNSNKWNAAVLRAGYKWPGGGVDALHTIDYLTAKASDAVRALVLNGVVDALDECDKIDANVAENLQKRRKVNLTGKALLKYQNYVESGYEDNATEGQFGYYIDALYGLRTGKDQSINVYYMVNIARNSADAYRLNQKRHTVAGIPVSDDDIDTAIAWSVLANLWCAGQKKHPSLSVFVEAQGALKRALAVKTNLPLPIFTNKEAVDTSILARANARLSGLLDMYNPKHNHETYHDTDYHWRCITGWIGANPVNMSNNLSEAVGALMRFYTVLCYLMNFVRVDESFGDGRYVYYSTNKISQYMHIQRVVQYGKTVQDVLSSTIEAIMGAIGFDLHASYPRFDEVLSRMRRCVFRLKRDMFHAPRYLACITPTRDGDTTVMHVDVESAIKIGHSDLKGLATSSMEKALIGLSRVLALSHIEANVATNEKYMSQVYALVPSTDAAERAFVCAETYGSECIKHFADFAVSADVALSAAYLVRYKDASYTHAVLQFRSPIAPDASKMLGLVSHERAMRATLPVSMKKHISVWFPVSTEPVDDVVVATRVLHMYCRVLCYLRNIAHLYAKSRAGPSEREEEVVALIMPYGWTVLAIINTIVDAMKTALAPDLLEKLDKQLRDYDDLFLCPRWGAYIGTRDAMLTVDTHVVAMQVDYANIGTRSRNSAADAAADAAEAMHERALVQDADKAKRVADDALVALAVASAKVTEASKVAGAAKAAASDVGAAARLASTTADGALDYMAKAAAAAVVSAEKAANVAEYGIKAAKDAAYKAFQNARDASSRAASALSAAQIASYYALAAKGDAGAMFALGTAYATDVPVDKAKAVKWLREAANHGDARAMSALSSAYSTGEGVVEDKAKAAEWSIKAAKAARDVQAPDNWNHRLPGFVSFANAEAAKFAALIAVADKSAKLAAKAFEAANAAADEAVADRVDGDLFARHAADAVEYTALAAAAAADAAKDAADKAAVASSGASIEERRLVSARDVAERARSAAAAERAAAASAASAAAAASGASAAAADASATNLSRDIVMTRPYYREVTWGTLWRPLLPPNSNDAVNGNIVFGHTPEQQLEMLEMLMYQAAVCQNDAVRALVTALSFKHTDDSVCRVAGGRTSMIDNENVDGKDRCLRYVAYLHTEGGELTPKGILRHTDDGWEPLSNPFEIGQAVVDRLNLQRELHKPFIGYYRSRVGYVTRAMEHVESLSRALEVSARELDAKMSLALGVTVLARRWSDRCSCALACKCGRTPCISGRISKQKLLDEKNAEIEGQKLLDEKNAEIEGLMSGLTLDMLFDSFSSKKSTESVMRALRSGDDVDTDPSVGVTLMDLIKKEEDAWKDVIDSLEPSEREISSAWRHSGDRASAVAATKDTLTAARTRLLPKTPAQPGDAVSAVRVLHQYYMVLGLMRNLRVYARVIDQATLVSGFDLSVQVTRLSDPAGTFDLGASPLKISSSQASPVSIEPREMRFWFFRESKVCNSAIDRHVVASLNIISRILVEVRDELKRKKQSLTGEPLTGDDTITRGEDLETRTRGAGAALAADAAVLAFEIGSRLANMIYRKYRKNKKEDPPPPPPMGFGWDDTCEKVGLVADATVVEEAQLAKTTQLQFQALHCCATQRKTKDWFGVTIDDDVYDNEGLKDEWTKAGFKFVPLSDRAVVGRVDKTTFPAFYYSEYWPEPNTKIISYPWAYQYTDRKY